MEQATTTILEYGILGAVIFFLAVAVVYLWRENNRLRDLMLSRALETLEKTINALNENSQTSRLLSEKIESAKRGK